MGEACDESEHSPAFRRSRLNNRRAALGLLLTTIGQAVRQAPAPNAHRGLLSAPRDADPATTLRAAGGFAVTAIDFRTDPDTARRYRVVSLVTHADIPDIVWADDEAGCYGVRGRDAKGKWIVVERYGPIRIVSARR
jgi:hypothetical protein